MITLHPHQLTAISDLRAALPTHRSVLLYAPPGAGKTVMAAYMAHGVQQRRRRVIFACHRQQLIDQTALTFDKFGIQYGYIAAGYQANPFASVHVASIDTLRNRYDRWPTDLLVVDEAHLSGAKTWTTIINHYRESGALVVGLSGSPCRLDGKPLRSNFAHMVQGPQPRWLINNGYLSEYRAFAPAAYDLRGLHTRAGDYIPGELTDKFDRPSIIGDAVSAWKQFAAGKRTVVYAFSIEHSRHVVEGFQSAGISAAHMDGTTPKDERRRIITDFADGRVQVLSSVDLLTTGFDLSAQVDRDVPIEAVSLLRPTQSLALAIQMMMRGLRYKPTPAVLLDHAGIIAAHGLPDAEREWSLDGSGFTRKPGEKTIATCVCHNCFAVYRPAYKCPSCGAVREVNGRQIDIQEGELAEIDIQSLRELDKARDVEFARREMRKQEGMCRTLEDWRALAKERGHSPGWAFHRYNARRKRA